MIPRDSGSLMDSKESFGSRACYLIETAKHLKKQSNPAIFLFREGLKAAQEQHAVGASAVVRTLSNNQPILSEASFVRECRRHLNIKKSCKYNHPFVAFTLR